MTNCAQLIGTLELFVTGLVLELPRSNSAHSSSLCKSNVNGGWSFNNVGFRAK